MPRKTSPAEDPVAKAWGKLNGRDTKVARAGAIPIYDHGNWRILRNRYTIYEGAENCADPMKVEHLRRNVEELYRVFPQTPENLEKLGIRVKRLVAHPIKNQADVTAWATSIFNVGPMEYPAHVNDTKALAYEDFSVQVPHKDRTYVVPNAPRGSGTAVLRDFNEPGSKKTYGPRHPYTKVVFAAQNGAVPKAPRSRSTAPIGVTDRVRAPGRPPATNGRRKAPEPVVEPVVAIEVPEPEELVVPEPVVAPEPPPDDTPKPRGRLQSVA
jgi:hypothetical protein